MRECKYVAQNTVVLLGYATIPESLVWEKMLLEADCAVPVL